MTYAYNPKAHAEAACEICERVVTAGEQITVTDGGLTVEHTACTAAAKIELLNAHCAGMSAASAKRFLANVRYGGDPVARAAYEKSIGRGGKPGIVPTVKGVNDQPGRTDA